MTDYNQFQHFVQASAGKCERHQSLSSTDDRMVLLSSVCTVPRAPDYDRGVRGSNPFGRNAVLGSIPDTWVTVYSGGIGNTFGPKGFRSFEPACVLVEVVEVIVQKADQRSPV